MIRGGNTRTGSALLLVFWALLVLTGTVMGWALLVQRGILREGRSSREIEARAMARSGMIIGLNPLVTRKTPLLERELRPGMGYSVRITSEGGRLNINWLLSGEDPRKVAILKRWLGLRGLDFHQCEVLADCLLDWVDADSMKRLNGAEEEANYHPANRLLQSVEEISQVRGSGPLVSQAGWKDDLTIYSQGPIDLSAAPARVLELIPGLGEARIARFVQYRRGPDGIDGTADDIPFASEADLQAALGLTSEQYDAIRWLVTFRDPTEHITSEGRAGEARRRMEVVAQKGTGNPQILSWKE